MSRALVLGGGGLAGVGWLTGVLFGLVEAGVDLTAADLFVGTSAGSVVATRTATGIPPDEQFETQVHGPVVDRPMELDTEALAATFAGLFEDGLSATEMRRRVGEAAMAADTPSEEERLAIMAARLPRQEWPEVPLEVTAVDCGTGAFTVFDRSSGVRLLDAVAASCAVPGVWPPVTIGASRYIDGGVRSASNVDLAEGNESVVVIAPIPVGFGTSAAEECEDLRSRGSQVALVVPDEASVTAFGPNLLDPAAAGPSARAGRAQAGAALDAVRAVWGG